MYILGKMTDTQGQQLTAPQSGGIKLKTTTELMVHLPERLAQLVEMFICSKTDLISSAAEAGHWEILDERLKMWVGSVRKSKLNCALYGACKSGSIELAKHLIDLGADDLCYALYGACGSDDIKTVRLLIEKGALIADTDFNHYDYFHQAIVYSGKEIFDLLIENVDLKNDFVAGAALNGILHGGFQAANMSAISFAMINGESMHNALYAACISGCKGMVVLAMVWDKQYGTGLNGACRGGHVEIAGRMISLGNITDVVAIDTGMDIAMRYLNTNIMDLMIEHGADIIKALKIAIHEKRRDYDAHLIPIRHLIKIGISEYMDRMCNRLCENGTCQIQLGDHEIVNEQGIKVKLRDIVDS